MPLYDVSLLIQSIAAADPAEAAEIARELSTGDEPLTYEVKDVTGAVTAVETT